MKKGLIAIIAAFLTLSSFAQATLHLRATREDQYNIPSSSWYYLDSSLYKYNSLLQDTAQLGYYYSQNTWKLRAKFLTSFAANGKLADFAVVYVDTLTGLVNGGYIKESFGYNAAGDTTSILIQHWDNVNSNWLNNGRIYFYPDANHHDTLALIQSYTSGSWQNSTQIQSTFNTAGLITNRTASTWNGTSYDPTSRIRYNYDANNLITSRTDQNWDAGASSWANTGQFLYTWNSSNDNIQREHRLWNTGTFAWDNDSMIYRTFNGTHMIVNQIVQRYNAGTSTYVNKYQTNFTRDSRDNITLEESDYWISNQWQHDERYTNQYNHFDLILDQVHDNYNSSISMYESYKRTHYYYDLINTGVDDLNINQGVSLYPNPVNGATAHIAFENVTGGDVNVVIYDLAGRMISKEARSASAGSIDLSIDVSSLSAGQYLVEIIGTNGAKYSAVKMIRQ